MQREPAHRSRSSQLMVKSQGPKRALRKPFRQNEEVQRQTKSLVDVACRIRNRFDLPGQCYSVRAMSCSAIYLSLSLYLWFSFRALFFFLSLSLSVGTVAENIDIYTLVT